MSNAARTVAADVAGEHADRDEALMAVVRASPELVGKNDRAGWLGLFADGGIVEDPIGTAPYVKGSSGEDRLAQFYDTFIAPNKIVFDVSRDIIVHATGDARADGARGEVVRDANIHTTLSSGLEVAVAAHLRYELCEIDGRIKIARMSAMWELAPLSYKTMKGGLEGIVEMCKMSWRMLRIQGIGGMMGYSKGLVSGIFGRGRKAVAQLADAVSSGDEEALTALFHTGDINIELLPEARSITPQRLLDYNLTVSQITAAGWIVSCAFELEGSPSARGLAFFTFDPTSKKIAGARFYCEEQR